MLSALTVNSQIGLRGATPRFRLVPNSIVSLNGRECIVERKLRDEWWFLDRQTREPHSESDFRLAELQASGQFYVVWRPGDRDDLSLPAESLNVGEGAHKENLRKQEYVLGCTKHPDYCRSRMILEPIIATIAQDRQEEAPGFTTVLNWVDRYDRHGATHGPAALADRHDKKGRHGKRFAEYQEKAIQVGIDVWLKRNTKANAYASVWAEVRKFDESGLVDKSTLDPACLDGNGRLKPPSRRQFERRCDEVDPKVRDAMRIGARYARQHYRTYTTTALPERPYSHVEVDHCTLDILLVHPKGVCLGRPDLIVFRDRATAMIIGYGLGYEQPSYTAFLDGLRSAMYRKDMSRFPRIKNPWPCFGRIENLYHDNALHFIGDNIKEAAQQLGINLIRLQPREPWLKGALERFFGTLNVGLIHRLPGTTLENAVTRRDHEHLGDATLGIDQFESLLMYWICDVYNASQSRALGHIRGFGGQSPLEAWNTRVKDFETDLLPKHEVFLAIAGHTSYRTLQRNGFTVDYIIYENPNLARILGNPNHKRRGIHGKSTQYKIVRNPHDLGEITVVNHHTGELIIVPATSAHLSYARGLTLTEHEIICANARRIYGNKHGLEELMKAKATLNEIAAAITNGPRFKTVQRKLARFLEGDRIRQSRSEIRTFPPDGTDYLAPNPASVSSVVVQPINTDAKRETSLPLPSHNEETLNPSGSADDDLSEIRERKNWSSGYAS
jgi:putative transposase